jgi:hypothetical protein
MIAGPVKPSDLPVEGVGFPVVGPKADAQPRDPKIRNTGSLSFVGAIALIAWNPKGVSHA